MTCGIYMIKNKVNNKMYIGKSDDIERRWRDHRNDLNNQSKRENIHIRRSWKKYREYNFEFTILLECEESDLNMYEEYYIFELMTYDPRVGYNKTYGGDGGRPTEETRKKLSESKKGENHPNYGKHLSEETRKNMSESHKIAMNRPSVREKISISMKGRNLSEEHRKNLSESKKGEKNYSYGKFGSNSPRSIPVVQLTLDGELEKIYGSAIDTKKRGFNRSAVSGCCKGKRKTHKGYKWMYLSDYEAMKKEG